MAKKSFTDKIKDDFKAPVIEDKVPSKARTKAFPGARLIPISDISPDPEQPRKKFDQEKLDDLVASVKSKGVIEPITVRFIKDESNYRVITGERRYKAAKIVGLSEIPCIIKDLDDQEVLTYQLIENLQREELSPIDEAAALKKLLDDGFTQVQVAKMIGKSQPYISQSLKILDLPENILEEAKKTEVPKEPLLQLAKAKEPEQQELWQDIKAGRTAEEIKVAVKKEKPIKGRPKIQPWTWKPEDKSFTIQVKFKKSDYGKEELIQALKISLEKLQQLELFDNNKQG